MSHTIPSGTVESLKTLAQDMRAHNLSQAAAVVDKAAKELERLESHVRALHAAVRTCEAAGGCAASKLTAG